MDVHGLLDGAYDLFVGRVDGAYFFLERFLCIRGGSFALSPILSIKKFRVIPTSVIRELSCCCVLVICFIYPFSEPRLYISLGSSCKS